MGAVAGAQLTAPRRKGGSNPRRRRLPVHGASHYTVHASYTVMRKNGSKLARVITLGQCMVTRSGEARALHAGWIVLGSNPGGLEMRRFRVIVYEYLHNIQVKFFLATMCLV